MMDRYEHARQQAHGARERAMQCESEFTRQEWLKVADLWEALAEEYLRLAETTEM
jgi:hypothetical protein